MLRLRLGETFPLVHDAALTRLGNFDPEGEPVTDPHRGRLPAVDAEDDDLGERGLGRRRDLGGVRVPEIQITAPVTATTSQLSPTVFESRKPSFMSGRPT